MLMRCFRRNARRGVAGALILSTLGLATLQASARALDLRVNGAGYQPLAPKRAVLEGVAPGAKLKVFLYDPKRPGMVPMTRGRVVYRAQAIQKFPDQAQSGPLAERWTIDFSDFRQSGDFELKVQGPDETSFQLSAPLHLSEFVYWDAMVPVMRAFYLQRSAIELQDDVSGLSRGLSHADDAMAFDPATGRPTYRKDVAGGWYDGPDYNKYVTPTSVAIGQLLSLYEGSPGVFNTLKLSYPVTEEGLGDLPDFLHEMRWGLDWLLAMQRSDGAFFRKVAGRAPVRAGAADLDTQDRFIFGVTTQDTAAASAALAAAARAYQRKDMGYAIKCLLAAEDGWKYLAGRGLVMETAPDDATGSREYLNGNGDGAYRFWAATELWLATGKPVYRQYLLSQADKLRLESLSWQNPGILAASDYLARSADDADPLRARLKTQALSLAQSLKQRADANLERTPYGVTLERFESDANQRLLAQTQALLLAHRLTRDPAWLRAAVTNTDFLFGLNPLDKIFITGMGARSVQRPCHPWTRASAKAVIPGLMVAGPNEAPDQAPDKALSPDAKTPAGQGALSYVDDSDACASNAPGLLYNATLATTLGMLNREFSPAAADPK